MPLSACIAAMNQYTLHEMFTFIKGLFITLLAISLNASATAEVPSLSEATTENLDARLDQIDDELEELAHLSLRNGSGAIGYRSIWHHENTDTEWIQIELQDKAEIDSIVLVPTLWRDGTKGFKADGFPAKFRILIGSDDESASVLVGEFDSSQGILPRIAPLVIPVNGLKGSWVRIEASELSKRAFDNKYILQLSEVMVFEGEVNRALRKHVKVPTRDPTVIEYAWSPDFLVDGYTPYLMDAAHGQKSIAFLAPQNTQAALILDLQGEYDIDQISLHTVDQSDTVPQGFASGIGMPYLLKIEAALDPEFSAPIPILEIKTNSINDLGPITMWPVPKTLCRYVRFTAIEKLASDERGQGLVNNDLLGFAEIEILANGKNFALNAPVRSSPNTLKTHYNRPLKQLTDGRNIYGEILPTKTWLEQLARRHDLLTERPIVEELLRTKYAEKLRFVYQLIFLMIALVISIAFVAVILRARYRLQIVNMRTRLAADLHDELGANLHTISLLGDLAESELNKPDLLKERIQRIRSMTDRTSTAVRFCTNMLNADGLYDDLLTDIKRFTEGILAETEHTVTFEGENHLEAINSQTKVDLFLFYKECLVNISRHSEATHFDTRLVATTHSIKLTVSDNGCGIDNPALKNIPKSLKRRARLLKGKLTVEQLEPEGTCITLVCKLK